MRLSTSATRSSSFANSRRSIASAVSSFVASSFVAPPFASIAASLLALLVVCGSAAAENWPNWRGPTHNGAAAGTTYPTKWSKTENVAWKVKLPGKGASTPAVWGDNIYLTCGIEGQNAIVCLDRKGKEKWRAVSGAEKPGKHKKATGSNSSPVTDGAHVFAYYKSGDLVCVDAAGKSAWSVNLQQKFGEDTLWWDLGTSPVLTQKHVVVAVMHSGPSFLVAFDKKSGEVAWRQDRNLDAPSEAAQSYSTPVVVNAGGKELLVVLGADHVTGHDAASGKELWRVGGLNPTRHEYFRSIASAVVTNDVVVAPYARGATITGIKLGGSGDVTKSHVAWTIEGLGADVPTPAAIGERFFVCTDKGEVACVEAATGKRLWQGKVEQNRNAYSSSPILAGGNLYLTREDGKVFVVEAGNEFKQIAANELDDEFTVATPAFVDGQILIRTLDSLYCIGK